MIISRLSIERPVFASVISLLLMVLGIAALLNLPVREYPDIDAPVVSVFTVFPGASAAVVDRDITATIEDAVSSIEGIDTIASTSRDEVSQITITFRLSSDLDAAAADVRDKLGQVQAELPEQSEDPIISKAASEADPIIWLTLTSKQRDRLQLTDYADRNLVDPLSIVPGVAQVIIGGERRYAMRIWLDREAMAARNITAADIVRRLRAENLELPAGRLESDTRELTLRATTRLNTVQAFRDLVLRQQDGYQITLNDVARVEVGAEDYRSAVRVDGEPAVGLGVVRQSDANILSVSRGIKTELERLRRSLPEDIDIQVGFDSSIFVEGSIREVVKTLAITVALVIAVIFLFLGAPKTTLIPASTIPVSLLATLIVLYGLGYSLNTLTLLALVLAIGLVVDDAIVVLENIFRRNQEGEPKLLAAARGSDQIAMAVLATTLVLVAVFIPLAFLSGNVGRLFTEFAVAVAAAVAFSGLVALTFGAMLSARVVDAQSMSESRFYRLIHGAFDRLSRAYRWLLGALLRVPLLVVAITLLVSLSAYWFYRQLPQELAPVEDRGSLIIIVQAPEGSSFDYTRSYVERIEGMLQPLSGDSGPLRSIVSIVGLSRQGPAPVDEALLIVQLKPWSEREQNQQQIVQSLQPQLFAIPGVRAFAVNPPSFGQQGFQEPVQFAIGGPDYATARDWAQQLLAQARQLDGLANARLDFKATRPQTQLSVDRRQAADLGISVRDIGTTLQTFFAEQPVTDYVYNAQTYDVIPQGEAADRITPADLEALYVRADNGELVPLSSVVELRTIGTAAELKRVNRSPSVTLSGSLAPGAALGDVLHQLQQIAAEQLPQQARINYLGQSREYQKSSGGVYIAFGLALLIVFLVLAAQFESFIDPVVIMLPVPLAVTGGLLALVLFAQSFNIYSQIALILLIGIMAKNAILVVEFANQLRTQGKELYEAIAEAAAGRLRPVLMTSIATTFGALPLALATGPGAEGRSVIGNVVIGGTILATLLTLFVVPGLYLLLARFTQPRGETARELRKLERA